MAIYGPLNLFTRRYLIVKELIPAIPEVKSSIVTLNFRYTWCPPSLRFVGLCSTYQPEL
jgi:hypothetical protein